MTKPDIPTVPEPPREREGETMTYPDGLPAHARQYYGRLRRWANRLRGRYGVPIYLCGSALREDNPDPRDWDIRITFPDEKFAVAFGPVDEWRDEGCTGNWTRTRWRWSDQCVKDTKDFVAWCHLNGDVQIYPESHVQTMYATLPRVRLDSYEPAAFLPPSAGTREPERTLRSFVGSVPNLTGGLDAVEYVRRHREGESAPPREREGETEDAALSLGRAWTDAMDAASLAKVDAMLAAFAHLPCESARELLAFRNVLAERQIDRLTAWLAAHPAGRTPEEEPLTEEQLAAVRAAGDPDMRPWVPSYFTGSTANPRPHPEPEDGARTPTPDDGRPA